MIFIFAIIILAIFVGPVLLSKEDAEQVDKLEAESHNLSKLEAEHQQMLKEMEGYE